jgi:hypothetical protein
MDMPMTRAIPLATAAVLLAPVAAHAATVTTDRQCYIQGESSSGLVSQAMTVGGSGWGPGSGWSFTANEVSSSGTADATGNWATADPNLTAPAIASGTPKPQTITLTAQQDGADVATTTFKVVNFLVKPRSLHGKPTGKTTWVFSGFAPGQKIYFHIRRGSHVYTAKAGRGAGPCGTLEQRLRRLPAVPASKIHYGKYKVFVDNRHHFSRGGVQYRATITIFKKFV